MSKQELDLDLLDFNLQRMSDKDAIRIKNEKIPDGSMSRIVLTFWGSTALRRQNKHGYFSARA